MAEQCLSGGISQRPATYDWDTQEARYRREDNDRRGALTQRLMEATAVAIVFWVPIIVVPIGERVGFIDLIMFVVAGLLIFSRHRGRLDLSHWLLIGYLAIAFLSLYQIHDSREQLKAALRWVRLTGICLPFFIGARMFVDHRLLRRVGWYLFWGGLVAILISLMVYWLQIPIRDAQQKIWYRGGGSDLRAGGLVGESTHFGHLVSTWMMLSVCLLILVRPVRRWRLVLATTVGLGGYATFAASSRAAGLGVLVFAIALLVLNRFRGTNLKNAVIGGMTALIVGALGLSLLSIATQTGLLSTQSRLSRQIERFLPSESRSVNRFSSGRIDSWKRYLHQSRSQPWLGCGYKQSPRMIPGRFADNSVLSTYLETGMLGLGMMLAFAMVVLVLLIKSGSQGNPYGTTMAAVWVGQLGQALLGDTYTLWLSMPVLYLITGIVLQLNPAPSFFESGHTGDTSLDTEAVR